MVISCILVGACPPLRMRVSCSHTAGTDALLLMTAVAGFRAMAAQAARRLCCCLHGMTGDKVCRMDEVTHDIFCVPHFNLEPLAHIVTIIATFLRVTVGALDCGDGCFDSVLPIPTGTMPQQCLRKKLL